MKLQCWMEILLCRFEIRLTKDQMSTLHGAAYCTRYGACKKGEEWFIHPFMLTRRKMIPTVPTKTTMQAAAMCTSPHACSPFVLGQNIYIQKALHNQQCPMASPVVKGFNKRPKKSAMVPFPIFLWHKGSVTIAHYLLLNGYNNLHNLTKS